LNATVLADPEVEAGDAHEDERPVQLVDADQAGSGRQQADPDRSIHPFSLSLTIVPQRRL
jgi:hypothetical protein